MYYIKVNKVCFCATTHEKASELINREIIKQKLQSNMTTRNIISNWICRKKNLRNGILLRLKKFRCFY